MGSSWSRERDCALFLEIFGQLLPRDTSELATCCEQRPHGSLLTGHCLTGTASRVTASQVTTYSLAIPSVLFARAGGFPLLAR